MRYYKCITEHWPVVYFYNNNVFSIVATYGGQVRYPDNPINKAFQDYDPDRFTILDPAQAWRRMKKAGCSNDFIKKQVMGYINDLL